MQMMTVWGWEEWAQDDRAANQLEVWGRWMNNIAIPSNYYYGAIEQSPYSPLVPVQLLIRQQQRTELIQWSSWVWMCASQKQDNGETDEFLGISKPFVGQNNISCNLFFLSLAVYLFHTNVCCRKCKLQQNVSMQVFWEKGTWHQLCKTAKVFMTWS